LIKKLTKHGNSLALIFDRPLLDFLKIEVDTPLEIFTDGQVPIIAPVLNEGRRDKFQKASILVNRKYGNALKRLAR
jgi:hypothetical protein